MGNSKRCRVEKGGKLERARPIYDLVRELHRRAREGFKHAPFQMAFWIGVVLFGGLGIWFEVYNLIKALILGSAEQELWRPLRIAVAGFFPAIIGATSLQMVFEDEIKAHRGAAVCAALMFLLLLFPTTDRDIPDGFGIALGTVLSCVSLWIWCAANGLSASYRQSPDAPVGDKPLDDPLAGETDLANLTH